MPGVPRRALRHRVARQGLAALTAGLALPLGAALLASRRAARAGLRERLGAVPRLEPGTVWIHGASVGEVLAASRLIDRLLKRGHAVTTSTATLSGRDVMRRARPEVPCHLAPLDHPWPVDRALSRARPAALVLIEAELWPVWIAAARQSGVPVVLVSGRVSDRTYLRYRRMRFIVGPTLRRLSAIGARTPVDRDRLVAVGAPPSRMSVTGDLKLECDDQPWPLPRDLEPVLAGLRLFVAGSTHAGEEEAALTALAEIERQGLGAALVIAPRRPERAAEIARQVRRAGRTPHLRTALGPAPLREGEVLVLDTVGELPGVYSRADVAFVGGSLVPRGGHNVLEPAQAARPVLYGPHTSNVRHAVEILQPCGAGRRVEDALALGRAAAWLLRDPAAAQRRGEAGRDALARHRGSAERMADLVESVLDRSRAAGP
jgi:3-deoxy-D-manno-octulosonic-acid transferase